MMANDLSSSSRLNLFPSGRLNYFYCAWVVIGYFGFALESFKQNFHPTSLSLSLTCAAAITLLTPHIVLTLRQIRQIKYPASIFMKLIAKLLGSAIIVLFMLLFCTFFWLPRVIHSIIGTYDSTPYFVSEKNDFPVSRGCNTEYWVRIKGWPGGPRDKVCITKKLWEQLASNEHVIISSTVSPLGVTVHFVIRSTQNGQ